jgi:fucose 4-O-acetylase-like acetyltransferase
MRKTDNSLAEQSSHIVEYDCLRVILTILVVLGHCVYYRILTDYGGIDYSDFITSKSLALLFCEKLKVLIYLFHMPLFVALSGALFSMSHKKYSSVRCLVGIKARKLLIPFFAVSLCYSIPLKIAADYFDKSTNVFLNLLIGQILVQGNTHLWFLPTLFIIFVVVYLIEKRIIGYRIIKLAVFLSLSAISSLIPIKIIAYIWDYLLWFYIGMCFDQIRGLFNARINRRILALFTIYVVVVCCGWYITSNSSFFVLRLLNILLEKCATCLLSICVYILSYLMAHTVIVSTKVYRLLLRNSFGIYLYSDSWNYIILAVCVEIFGGWLFDNNIGTLFFVILRFLLTLGISVLITEILRKCKVRYLF